MGGTEKRGGDTKILKRKGVKLGQGVGALKGGGAGTLLQTMPFFCSIISRSLITDIFKHIFVVNISIQGVYQIFKIVAVYGIEIEFLVYFGFRDV